MKKSKWISLVTVLAVAAVVPQALADMTNLREPPVAVSGTALQDAFNDLTKSGPGIDVIADQTHWAVFENSASGGSVATMMVEVTDLGGPDQFGLYDVCDPTNKILVFDGAAAPGTLGAQKLISFLANGQVLVGGELAGTFTGPRRFGFYLDVFSAGADDAYDATRYTLDELNPGGEAAALVFQGDGETSLGIPPLNPGIFSEGEWIIAFDADADKDFADMAVLVESITPVPAPGAVVLGMIGLSLVGARRKRKQTLA